MCCFWLRSSLYSDLRKKRKVFLRLCHLWLQPLTEDLSPFDWHQTIQLHARKKTPQVPRVGTTSLFYSYHFFMFLQVCLKETDALEARTVTSCMCITIQAMNSATEMNSLQVVLLAMAGDLNDLRGTGDEIREADTEIWAETDHVRETGIRTGIGGIVKGTGAVREMMGVVGIVGTVRIENVVEHRNGMKRGVEGNTAVMRVIQMIDRYQTGKYYIVYIM